MLNKEYWQIVVETIDMLMAKVADLKHNPANTKVEIGAFAEVMLMLHEERQKAASVLAAVGKLPKNRE